MKNLLMHHVAEKYLVLKKIKLLYTIPLRKIVMSKKKETILVIEDSDETRKGYCDILIHEGYNVLETQDGREPLNIMRSQNPNLILLDLLLPEMSGFEVPKKIKADPRIKDIPVIVLSALDGESHIQKILESGAADYIVKLSHSPKEIISKIRKYLT